MNVGQLFEFFRREVNDTADPPLWSDEDVLSYAHDAQQMFSRLTGGTPDSSTADLTTLLITPSMSIVPLHPKVLKIRAAFRTDTGRPVEVVNYEDLPTRGWWLDGREGPLKALITGMDEGFVHLYPTAQETVTVKLVVFRLPLQDINIDTPIEQPLEIPEQHHTKLVRWMQHLAYLKQDTETYNRGESDRNAAIFRDYCEIAKREVERLRHKPRAVQYGGL